MAVAAWTGACVDWHAEFEALKVHLAPALGRSETRHAAGAFIEGVLSSAERKTGWMLAEQAGMDRPYRIQSLLGRSSWSADVLRDSGSSGPPIYLPPQPSGWLAPRCCRCTTDQGR